MIEIPEEEVNPWRKLPDFQFPTDPDDAIQILSDPWTPLRTV